MHIAVLFGGNSVEHEISLASASHILPVLREKGHTITAIGIDKNGDFHLQDSNCPIVSTDDVQRIALAPSQGRLSPLFFQERDASSPIDLLFPILHGPFGEDGTIQGMCELLNIPYVGEGVLSSSLAIDKDIAKKLWSRAGLDVAKWLLLDRRRPDEYSLSYIAETIKFPLFVKPCSLGSSVGIQKVHSIDTLQQAIEQAFTYDTKVLVEEAVQGKEVQCGILGSNDLYVSVACQVIPAGSFHSYASKYIKGQLAEFVIPAKLSQREIETIQEISVRAYKELQCESMARVDSFLTDDGRVIVNELNTIPGLTATSVFLKLWHASGLTTSSVVDILIELALDRFKRKSCVAHSFFVEA